MFVLFVGLAQRQIAPNISYVKRCIRTVLALACAFSIFSGALILMTKLTAVYRSTLMHFPFSKRYAKYEIMSLGGTINAAIRIKI